MDNNEFDKYVQYVIAQVGEAIIQQSQLQQQ